MTGSGGVQGRLFLHPNGVRGHAYDPAEPTRRWAVELVLDGWMVDLARADAFAPEIADIGDGCYGFGFPLPEGFVDRGGTVEIRLANTGETVGDPLSLPTAPNVPGTIAGRVAWTGGLRMSGWVPLGDDAGVRAIVERRAVAEVSATGWISVMQGALRTTMAAFELHLPALFADGCVHRVSVVDRNGRPLAGSPCSVLAFPDGLRALLVGLADPVAEDARVDIIERLLPQSISFSEFERWEARHPPPPLLRDPPVVAPVIVALVGEDVGASIDSLEAQRLGDWVALQLPERDGPATFAPRDLLDFMAGEPGAKVVVMALAGTAFRPEALARLGAAAGAAGALAYPDLMPGNGCDHPPLLWPAYDAERMLEQGYAGFVFAAPASAVVAALRRGASSTFEVALALAGPSGGERPPVHVPEVMARLPRLDPRLGAALARAAALQSAAPASPRPPDAETGLPAARVARLTREPAFAVGVIQPEPVPPALDAIEARLGPAVGERFVVSHRALPMPRGWRNIVVPGWRNPSRLRNAAIAAATSARILLLDAGIEPLDDGTAAEMAGRMEAPRVAAVSGVLSSSEGYVLGAGAVLGIGFSASAAFAGVRHGSGGYGGALRVARACGAVETPCLMIDRAAVAAAGGFDEIRFPEFLGGIDLSLKLRASDRRLLVTPDARFVRRVSWAEAPRAAREAETDRLRRRWGEALLGDPFYHPSLNRDAPPYTGLAWPPLARGPRRPDRPEPAPNEMDLR